ncbi:unnamed protein product [Staurois parvus]|uniref:Uncharacterized protein n=1 Tax=Staurois parvus TaxID=386267 RepID=A0ABN9G535_9NEOB|nr:unnamed protein product [Staurois parvus]
MAMHSHSHAKQCAYSEAHPPPCSTQHTANPLTTPHVNPVLPSVISTVSVLF